MEKLRHLYGWDAFHTTMTLNEHSAYKYPDGIVLTLKTANHADHYFVERAYALQLAGSIKESLLAKLGKRKQVKPEKPAEPKPAEAKSKQHKKK
jgi:hypothetical protein